MFVARYLVRMDATRAYQDSYPNAAYTTARSEGSKLLVDPRISQQIRAFIAGAKRRLRRSADRALDELAALAFSSVADVFDASGAIIPPHELSRDISVAVKKLKRQEILGGVDEETGRKKIIGHTIEVEMHDKIGPLKLLGQHYGVFAEAPPPADARRDFAAILEAAAQRVLDGLRGKLIEGERAE